MPFVASALAQAAVMIAAVVIAALAQAAVVIAAVVLTVGTSKLARHGMVLGFDSSYF